VGSKPAREWRCGQMFFLEKHRYAYDKPFAGTLFNRRCLHCGLPKWANDDPDRGAGDR
jgi:hypothetical protein